MTDRIILQTDALSIGYRRARRADVVVARNLNFVLRPGELVCLLGPNGAGKSTLMRTLARLQPPLSGQIWLDDRPLGDLRPGQLARRLSVVLTERVDVGAMSGYGLVSLGRHPHTGWTGALSERDRRIVHWALQAVRAQDLADRRLLEMSDGERQKVLIARALAQEPRVMLLDEPTAFLDLPRRVEVMELLRRLAQENQQAILLSTHDLDLALRNADRLWLLAAEGALYDGAPEDLILNGAFERVFAGEGVTFDRHSGFFHTRQQTCGRVLVHGHSAAAFWTRRALERIGYAVVADADALSKESAIALERRTDPCPDAAAESTISVRVQDSGPTYALDIAGREDSFTTLDALTTYLRRIHPGITGVSPASPPRKGEADAETDQDLHAQRR